MGFLWFGRKKDAEDTKIKGEIKGSFEKVKQDMHKISAWIKHLNSKDKYLEEEISLLRQDIDDIKQFVSFFDTRIASRVFKQRQTPVYKQTPVYAVQTGVQTAVQTAFLQGLTANERLIVLALMNSDGAGMKLSCDDLAVMLGKEPATVRVQINNIKQKNEKLISEYIEKSGKKRYYIDEKLKGLLIKKSRKVRENRARNREK